MADIFLSYASEDIAVARAFARLLSARGWDVWWDHKIPPGKTYVEVIEQELETCKCVIVVWSIHSVVSEWVKREAAEGGDRQILVPVRLDDSRLPFEFRRLQAADLRGWQGEPDRPELLGVFQRLSEIVPSKGAPSAASERVPTVDIPAAAIPPSLPPIERSGKTPTDTMQVAPVWWRRHRLPLAVSLLAIVAAVALTLNQFRQPAAGPAKDTREPAPAAPVKEPATPPPAPTQSLPSPRELPSSPGIVRPRIAEGKPAAKENPVSAPPVAPKAAPPGAPPSAKPDAPASPAINGVPFRFISLPSGQFTMGCSSGDSECEDNETPVRRVTVDAFQIGATEVTQEQWEAVMGNNPSDFKGDQQPVEHISWVDSHNFVERLNQRRDGFIYRLPKEAEWEYAARAGATSPMPLTAIAWFGLAQSSGRASRPQVAATKAANAWGLHDMLGNVAEWCEDWFSPDYQRVIRGGSWIDGARSLRVSARGKAVPGTRDSYIGLRLVRDKQ